MTDKVRIDEAGYHGYSMSNNAVAAYADGEMPLSKWTKQAILDAVAEIDEEKAEWLKPVKLQTLKDKLLTRTSWHHTSKFYNRTDFYSLDEDTVESLTEEDVAKWVAKKTKPSQRPEFEINNDTLVKYNGTNKEITLPDEVIVIGKYAFLDDDYKDTGIVSVIGNNVTTILGSAFRGCKQLKSITFPNCESVGEAAFIWCSSLSDVYIPKVKDIANDAFNRCTSLKEVSFDRAEYIGDRAFDECASLKSVSLPNAKEIGWLAFAECKALTDIDINSNAKVDKYAFGFPSEKDNSENENFSKPIKERKEMPVMKVKGGYRWGEKGKVYPDRASAERQGRAIKASQAEREKEERYSKRRIKEAEEYIARVEVYYDTLEPIYADDDMLDVIEDEILWDLSLVDYAWGDKGEVHIVVTDNTEVHVMAEIRCDSKSEVRAYERMVGERSDNSLYDIVERVLKDFGIY